jgi:glycosyltransferase involved in cell wall biosynthesis
VRIALIGPAHPDQGGAARHTTELAYRLTAAGHNVIVESWRAPGPSDPEEYPRTYRRLARYRPDGWIAAGRRLRSADLVVFALPSQAQVIARMPPHLPAATPVLDDHLAERSVYWSAYLHALGATPA